jgi:hypothetical protein
MQIGLGIIAPVTSAGIPNLSRYISAVESEIELLSKGGLCQENRVSMGLLTIKSFPHPLKLTGQSPQS